MTKLSDDWWPRLLSHVPQREFLSKEMVIVSEISEGANAGSFRDVHLALLNLEDAERLTEIRESYPFSYMGCGLLIDSNIEMETLATKWEGGGNHHVQFPSLNFVKHFRLVPRLTETTLVWDDLDRPIHDVVCANLRSKHGYPNTDFASIRVRRDYLLKYAEDTERAIVALWYESNKGSRGTECNESSEELEFGTHWLPGRKIQFGPSQSDCEDIIAECWGILMVHTPAIPDLEVQSAIKDNFHTWPGLDQPVCGRTRWGIGEVPFGYVSDSVLGRYEERPDIYTVHPDTGGVSYEHQWSVCGCRRVGRDQIRVDLKKLYEGVPEDEISHWNNHAVSPPTGLLEVAEGSVGFLAKKIVLGLIELGEALSALKSDGICKQVEGDCFVRLDTDKLKRTWWYEDELIRPVTHHIPLDIGRERFLNRCKSLTKLVIESLDEGHLRNLLLSWKVDPKSIESLKSLKLLNTIMLMSQISVDSGLSLKTNAEEINERYVESCRLQKKRGFLPSPVSYLFEIYELRNYDAHQGGTENKILATLDINKADVVSGWGRQLDKVYQEVAQALHDGTDLLRQVRR